MKPLLSALDIRDATVRDYTRMAERMGAPVDPERIRRQAEADLMMVANYETENPPAPKAVRDTSDRVSERRADELDAAIADINAQPGGRVAGSPRSGPDPGRRRVRDRIIYRNPKKLAGVVWWWPHAMARVKRILAGARGTSIITALADAESPKLAREFMQHFSSMIQRRPLHPPSSGRPYDGVSDRDAERMFVRAVENICDRSRKQLGAWRHL